MRSTPQLLKRFTLDRQAMGIPSGDILAAESRQILIPYHNVLEHLIERGTHMDIAVGIGRAVMQDILRPALAVLNDLLVSVGLIPFLHHSRFALRQ